MIWPEGKQAALAIIDDTDDAQMPGIRDVYDLLTHHKIVSTKTVWVYPVRDTSLFKGESLSENPEYLAFIKSLSEIGFEIGLHNVGSGDFKRGEILEGIELFRDLLGFYPSLHVNHSYNKDNIYGGDKRFSAPFNYLVRRLYSGYSGFEGDEPLSDYFWGDVHKRLIKYSRSYELDDLNLLNHVRFPYSDKKYSDWCNLFYPAVFCSNQDLFNHHVSRRNLNRLISEKGCSILYTHFGYFTESGAIDRGFARKLRLLEEFLPDLWIAPVGEVLDYLLTTKGEHELQWHERFALEAKCIATRVKYRYVKRLDDYHYKSKMGKVHRKTVSD